jgi:hypothetical protein
MAGHAVVPHNSTSSTHPTRRRGLRSYREHALESDVSDSEPKASTGEWVRQDASKQNLHHSYCCSAQTYVAQLQARSRRTDSMRRRSSLHDARSRQQTQPTLANPISAIGGSDSPYESQSSHLSQSSQRRNRASTFASLSRGSRASASRDTANAGVPDLSTYENDLALALEHGILEEDLAQNHHDTHPPAPEPFSRAEAQSAQHQPAPYAPDLFAYDSGDDSSQQQFPRLYSSRPISYRPMAGSAKRSRDRFEGTDNSSNTYRSALANAVAILSYRNTDPDPEATDIWPEFCSSAKLPARYALLNKIEPLVTTRTKRRVPKVAKKRPSKRKTEQTDPGRPQWNLPVELVALIAGYLDRDDIKSLRMVSHELNHYVSQVIFQTVVVPFNTEIYGMLAQSQKPDPKGKGRARRDKLDYSWKNAHDDEVYNGHGLDVFKGFGRHISKYGMSFEVNEESLSDPPIKSITEKQISFWGNYDWPYDKYRRFDAVAGLETAADETPRMKIAFSELTKVKELALSVDSGLGWLNGPDRSIRARILRRPPAVFGASKTIPDRRAQAQQELWRRIETIHENEEEDIKLATLYRLNGMRPLSEVDESRMLALEQPGMPYMDQHLIHEAIPHDTAEVPLPTSFDDPEVLDRFVLGPSSSNTGILFTSVYSSTNAGQIMSPVIPADLTKAQKEWLLETEWAQRAFMSSYMLSIIDNPLTFTPVHTLNISRLSDRYLDTLNRADFWDALPNLKNLTLMVVPGWRDVYKDEAGFVDTPRINPINSLDQFCDLLANHVANRRGVQSLTLGWIGGGEHAEGLHARNKLIMPAPLIGTTVGTHGNPVLASEIITETDQGRLSMALMRFPYVERLVLRNCWITPASLLQFVKIHDDLSLKNLVLDSVSLTGTLRPNGNGNQTGQPGGALNLPLIPAPPNALFGTGAAGNASNNNAGGQGGNNTQAQPLPNNNQLLAWLSQTLQVQTQVLQILQQAPGNAGGIQQQTAVAALFQHIHNQTQQLHQITQQNHQIQQRIQQQTQLHYDPQHAQNQQNAQDQFNIQQQITAITQAVTALTAQVQMVQQQQVVVIAPPQQILQPPTDPQSLLHSQPREGSWTNVIDIISPGTNLEDFGSEHSKADPDRQTSLQSIKFISCGYAKLPYAAFDQAGIDRGNRFATATCNPLLVKRYNALTPAMMTAKYIHLGEIVQDVDPMELAALDAGWDLKTGWEDVEEARAVEFDGYLAGGTSRFTGKVQVSDKMRDGGPAS